MILDVVQLYHSLDSLLVFFVLCNFALKAYPGIRQA